jgi:uncharacterized protein GlcG (DUF336 family)
MIVNSSGLASDVAAKLVIAAIEHAAENGWRVAVAVVDSGGLSLAQCKMDNAALAIIESALDKACTAAALERPRADYLNRLCDAKKFDFQVFGKKRLIHRRGGLPIFQGSELIGGIGVSGAEESQDIACGAAALEKLGLSSKKALYANQAFFRGEAVILPV